MSNSIEQNLVTIAENRQKIYDAGRNAVINELKELQKGTANGEAVAISDISPIEHNMGVNVSSKNLIPYPNYSNKNTTVTQNGVDFTDNGDGTITVNGTATKNFSYVFLQPSKPLKLVAGDTYSLSGCPSTGGYNSYYLNIQTTDFKTTYNDVGEGRVFTAPDLPIYLYITIRSGVTLDNLVFKPQIEKDTVASTYTSYIEDVSTVKLDALGKNLWNADLNKIAPVQYASATSGEMAKRNGWEMELIAGVTYTVKATPKESSFTESYLYGCVTDKDDKVKKTTVLVANKQLQTHTFTAEDGWKLKLYDGIAQNGLTDTKTMVSKFNIQLEIGEKATPYEPHIQPVTYIPNADGTIEGVKSVCPNMTLLTNTEGVMIECNYKKDINPIFDKYVRD